MITIYDVSYLQNLERTKVNTKRSNLKSGQSEEFARILSELEQKPDKLSDSSAVSQQSLVENPVSCRGRLAPGAFSNFTSNEINSFGLISKGDYSSDKPHFNEAVASVKIPAKPVKLTTVYMPQDTKEVSIAPEIQKPKLPVEIEIGVKAAEKDTASKFETMATVGQIKAVITAAGQYHGVDPHLGIAVAESESGLNPRAVSQDGHESKGIFQLLDTTAHEMFSRLGLSKLGSKNEYDPFNPEVNSHLGMGYLRYLLDSFSKETQLAPGLATIEAKSAVDLEKFAVAAFNAGEGTVARAQNRVREMGGDPSVFMSIERFLPDITKTYVKRVSNIRRDLDASQES